MVEGKEEVEEPMKQPWRGILVVVSCFGCMGIQLMCRDNWKTLTNWNDSYNAKLSSSWKINLIMQIFQPRGGIFLD